jgi:hypothetical protein
LGAIALGAIALGAMAWGAVASGAMDSGAIAPVIMAPVIMAPRIVASPRAFSEPCSLYDNCCCGCRALLAGQEPQKWIAGSISALRGRAARDEAYRDTGRDGCNHSLRNDAYKWHCVLRFSRGMTPCLYRTMAGGLTMTQMRILCRNSG